MMRSTRLFSRSARRTLGPAFGRAAAANLAARRLCTVNPKLSLSSRDQIDAPVSDRDGPVQHVVEESQFKYHFFMKPRIPVFSQ
ncbi:MAG: hypothetical protein MHMPM18_000431 [Marteilia pararefringens]